MRVLFYLPVVNHWWFEHIIVPLLRRMTHECDVHAMLAPPWHGTGIEPALVTAMAGAFPMTWHWLDAPGHEQLRTDGSLYPGLQARIAAIAPDLTLCRAADLSTPRSFPGTVRYIMEGSIPLIDPSLTRIQFADTIFDHGFDPVNDRYCDDAAAIDAWEEIETRFPPRTGPALSDGRLLLALPLEYEGPEMFFRAHARFPTNANLLRWLMSALPDDVLLAVTTHPINNQGSANQGLQKLIAGYGERIALIPETGEPGRSTAMLARRADGMIVCDSKSIFLPAMFGTPCLRLSTFRTAPWMRAYEDLATFMTDLRAGTAVAAEALDAHRWVARHLASGSIDVANPNLTAAQILTCAGAPQPLCNAA